MEKSDPKSCPLCHSQKTQQFAKGPLKRAFWQCMDCCLLFTPEENQLSRDAEKARYETHNNSPEEQGYVNFLKSAVDPAMSSLKPGMQGLDYGCGPGPTISVLLAEKGISCKNYDPYFFPDLPAGPFDFIFCTETFEHFNQPGKEVKLLDELMKPGGFLIVMTSFWEENNDFNNWAYARDLTHVCFYHEKTMDYLAQKFDWDILFNDHDRVIIFQKGH